jgi:hypothetical protein
LAEKIRNKYGYPDNTMNNNTKRLKRSFQYEQRKLKLELEFASGSIEHAPTKGAVHEQKWIEILSSYLPKRYEVDTGIIIDSKGQSSDQIDVVIFDPLYMPTLLDQQQHRYIPIEAVYAIFECKPKIDKENLRYASEKAESVRRLERTTIEIAHAGGVYPAKPLIPIIAGILAPTSGWTEGLQSEAFKRHLPSGKLSKLDCGCALEHGCFNAFEPSLKVDFHDGALMIFIFDLLSKLQSTGTVPAVDWQAYANIMRD